MTEEAQKNRLIISHKKGVPVYESNPSIPGLDGIKKRKPVRFGDSQRGFIVDGGNGEVLAAWAFMSLRKWTTPVL